MPFLKEPRKWAWNIVLLPYLMSKLGPDAADNNDIFYETALGYGYFACPGDPDPADYINWEGSSPPSNRFYGMNYSAVTAYGIRAGWRRCGSAHPA